MQELGRPSPNCAATHGRSGGMSPSSSSFSPSPASATPLRLVPPVFTALEVWRAICWTQLTNFPPAHHLWGGRCCCRLSGVRARPPHGSPWRRRPSPSRAAPTHPCPLRLLPLPRSLLPSGWLITVASTFSVQCAWFPSCKILCKTTVIVVRGNQIDMGRIGSPHMVGWGWSWGWCWWG